MKRFSILLATLTILVSCGPKTVNPERFGLSPESPAEVNTRALQKALDGGNCTVKVSTPGTYRLNGTIFLDDNTVLECAEGVLFQKDSVYSNMFINRGAFTRQYNSNIILKGLRLSVNNNDCPPTPESAIFGLRAQLAFLCARNFQVLDYRCEDLGKMQYAVQFNQCDNFILDGFVLRGDKDGVHLSSSHDFVIRNGICQTYDDCLALNASDWASSNCVDGDISNGLIENVTDEVLEPHSGELCRLLTGAWIDWHEGVSVRRSDSFVHNGKLYKVLAKVKDTSYVSITPPSIETFEGCQNDPAGFAWKLVRTDSVYYSTNIRNITIRNLKAYSGRSAFSEEIFFGDNDWARTLHDEIADDVTRLPSYDNIVIEDCDLSGSAFMFWRQDRAHSDITFRRVSGFTHGFMVQGCAFEGMKNITRFEECDFTSNKDNWDFDLYNGGCIHVKDCKFNGQARFKRNEGTYVEE